MLLITGGTGFVGGHLVTKLRALGEPVRCLVRAASARRLPVGVEAAVADLSGSGQGIEAALDGVGTVIHLAGVTKALRPADYYAGNARATEILARALKGRGVRLVQVSSLAAIGPSLDGSPVNEETAAHPVSTYGKSKLEGERIACQILPDTVVVRPPVVYGPADTGVFQILKSVARGFVLEIAGGERWFSAIYVEDLVDGLLAAARTPAAAGRSYFLTHPKPATWQELGDTAARIMGCRPRTIRIPVGVANTVGFCAEFWSHITRNPAIISREKVSEACYRSWTCDPGRAAGELKFEAPTPLASGLAKTLAWYKEAGWLKY